MSTSASVMDINADLGEGAGNDEALMASGITSVNVACGGHAGDDNTMRSACQAVRRQGLALGAHPGYEDRVNFGRRPLEISPEALRISVEAQLLRLQGHALAAGLEIGHVKPHGALYHQANETPALAEAFWAAMQAVIPGSILYGPPQGALRATAGARGGCFVAEGFIDRGYQPDGRLVPRGSSGDLITNEAEAVEQALLLARGGRVATLCVHGDGAESCRLLNAVRRALVAEGIRLSPPSRFCLDRAGELSVSEGAPDRPQR